MSSHEEKGIGSITAWKKAAKCPKKCFANPVVLNEHEILISPYGKNEMLRRYNIEKDEFYSYIPYPTEIEIKFHTIAVDRESGKIYLYDGSDKVFVEFDMKKQLITKCRKKKQSIVGNGKFSSSLVHDKKFHVIGGTEKDRHLVWDTMTQKFIEHEMIHPSPAGHSSILLGPRTDNPRIVVFGGNESIKLSKYLDTIYICDIHPEIAWRKCKSFKMPYKQYFFGTVVYKQAYILIFGGKQKDSKIKDNSGLSDEIWILNLKTWKWTRSHLKCPKKAKYYAVMTDKDIIHLFEFEGNGGHWKIPVSILINQSSSIVNPTESLQKQFEDVCVKLNRVGLENAELLDANKEYKHKIKSLKKENKHLTQENADLKEKIQELKDKKGSKNNQTSLLQQANADYKALQEKYQKLKSMQQNGSRNGNHNNNNNDVMNIMNNTNMNTNVNTNNNQSNVNPFDENPFGNPNDNPFGDANPFGEDYDFWHSGDIIDWIKGLENGRYRKYLPVVSSRLKQRNIDGEKFVNFQLNDLKMYGVTNYQDACALLQRIRALKQGNNANNNNFNNNNNNNDNMNNNMMNNNNNMMNRNNNNNSSDFLDAIFN